MNRRFFVWSVPAALLLLATGCAQGSEWSDANPTVCYGEGACAETTDGPPPAAVKRVFVTSVTYLVDGETRVFNNKANLATIPRAAISLDEMGKRHEGSPYEIYWAWTGSNNGGTRTEDTCSDWLDSSGGAGTYGRPVDAPSQSWGGGPVLMEACLAQAGLICFEQ